MIAAAASIATPSVQLGAILPAFFLTVGALLLLLVGSFESRSARVTSGVIGLATFAAAGLGTWHLWHDGNRTAFSGQLATDRYSALVQAIVCASGVLAILLGWGTRRLGERIAEYYSLLCFAGAGMCLLASANGFVSLFVAFELFSISLYVLCALDVDDASSLESGLKYLVTGSVGSACAALRQRPDLHRDGLAALRPDRPVGRQRQLAHRDPAVRHRDDRRGPRVQGLGGAVPHVDARRLRGRARRPSWRSWRPRRRRSRWRRCCAS